jgi:hypothetical protein
MKFAQNIGMAPRQSATESLDGSRRDTLPQFGKPASSRREPRHEMKMKDEDYFEDYDMNR